MSSWLTVAFFVLLWWVGTYLASKDNFLTVSEMHARGISKGIPWVGHIGCSILDLLPFPLLIGLWVGMYGEQWTLGQMLIMASIGTTLSAVMHLTYIEAGKKFPEFVTYGGKLTPAGWVHVAYMACGLGIIGLAYLCTPHPQAWLVWTTSIYLIVHVTLGVHVIHKIWKPEWFPYHQVLDAGTLAPIFGSALVLGGFTWWALQ